MLKRESERVLYLYAVAKGDVPIFQAQLIASGVSKQLKDHFVSFVVHMALDSVDARVWTTSSMQLKEVDAYSNLRVSCFVTAGHIRFLLLHDQRTDESGIKTFFQEVYELYVKVLLNPFYEKNTPITSAAFDERVRALAKKLLM